MAYVHLNIFIYSIAGNIGRNYIWRIARKSKLAYFNLAVFASPPTRLRDGVTYYVRIKIGGF